MVRGDGTTLSLLLLANCSVLAIGNEHANNLEAKVDAGVASLLDRSTDKCNFWTELLRLHVGNDTQFCEEGFLDKVVSLFSSHTFC